MKIGIVLNSFLIKGSGVGNYTVSLIKALIRKKKRGTDFYLIHNLDVKKMMRQKTTISAKIPLFLRSGLLDLSTPLLLNKDFLDVVHFPILENAPMSFALTANQIVGTIHGLSEFVLPHPYAVKYNMMHLKKMCLRLLVKRVTALIALSNAEKENITRYLKVPGWKIYVAYHGIDHERFKPLKNLPEIRRYLKDKYEIPNSYILHVSSGHPKKNIPTILQALYELKKKGLFYKLVIAGPSSSNLERLTNFVKNLNLENLVTLLGHISDEDLRKLYSCAELFIFPSLLESFGFPPLEAAACGVPVIASNVYSMPEILGRSAILVNPLDKKALVNAIHDVLTDPSLKRKMAKNGLRVAKEFTWERCATEHLRIYKKVYHA